MHEWLRSNQRTLLIIIPLLLVCFLLFNPFKNASTEIPTPLVPAQEPVTPAVEEAPKSESILVQVDIKGMVNLPGVYQVNDGDRVVDLIQLAGGTTDEAEMTSVNLAQKIHDEMVVYIPAVGEEIPSVIHTTQSPERESGESQNGKINLNEADSTTLQTIPGIGQAKAQAIIDFRDTVGRFESIEDIKKISGIGDKTFDKMEELIDTK
ncbi:helix-hairpin-helix domain-containing protein [Jeotgalibacillus marinus]|uniref:Helix-hairpin-helix domain-containing protein n=1 Tax=Jeotgalibacillus marinus TaxID=86667 RepID=A0ABV3Q113_9BACL